MIVHRSLSLWIRLRLRSGFGRNQSKSQRCIVQLRVTQAAVAATLLAITSLTTHGTTGMNY
jgi:hypothetical protein